MDNKKKNLEYFMHQPYCAFLRKAGGVFYLYIPELSLTAEGSDLNQAYARLEEGKEQYFKRIIAMNAENEIEPPSVMNIKGKKPPLSIFGPFIIKLSVILVTGFIFLNLTASIAKYLILEVKGVPYKIISKISSMPEEEVERRKLLIRDAAVKLKPFVDELRILFKDEGQHEKKISE